MRKVATRKVTNNSIEYFRKQKGYSVNKLANLSGVSQSYLRDIELENKNPTVAFLTIVCNALGISLQDFFNDDDTVSITNNPLLQRIYQLNQEQQEALLKFLDTL